MKPRELANLGVPAGEPMKQAVRALREAARGGAERRELRAQVVAVIKSPAAFVDDPLWGGLARALPEGRPRQEWVPREPIGYRRFGDDIDDQALGQMDDACRLPISVAAALMPDAHVGYGLPIGGVLATRGAVIPYAVGMDIACRMKLTVLDLPVGALDGEVDRLRNALEGETRFGVGASFDRPLEHEVMDDDWSVSPLTARLKDRARSQLGTSGSGNHFVELGTLTLGAPDLGLDAGVHLALLSHSGSRGTGGEVATHYSRLAAELHPELPKRLAHLAWLDLGTDEGQEYWRAMELMGRYAAANHELIHRRIARRLGARVLLDVENHHNFAWRERLPDGQEVIVHRKGATPAARGVIGVIPGSMATPGYVVRGKGEASSLDSASHGAGRRMSRAQARESLTWHQARRFLDERKVRLLSAGLDEAPMAYKDIDAVMAAQAELVEVIARFDPRMVKMAPAGERPED